MERDGSKEGGGFDKEVCKLLEECDADREDDQGGMGVGGWRGGGRRDGQGLTGAKGKEGTEEEQELGWLPIIEAIDKTMETDNKWVRHSTTTMRGWGEEEGGGGNSDRIIKMEEEGGSDDVGGWQDRG